MFLANWFIAAQVRNTGTHPRLTVPYSYFRAQAQAGNVADVSSQGETIQGSFRHVITYPAGRAARSRTCSRPSARRSPTTSSCRSCSART
jgi:cell division protease FtsH